MKVLVACAMEKELMPIALHYSLGKVGPGLWQRGNLQAVVTGIGLVAMGTALSLMSFDSAVNIGTCGSLNGTYTPGTLVYPQGFIQADFDPAAENKALVHDPCLLGKKAFPVLASVNSFATAPIPGADLVDMEGYAFAAFMEAHKKPYRVLKVVSDTGSNEEMRRNTLSSIEANINKIAACIDTLLRQ